MMNNCKYCINADFNKKVCKITVLMNPIKHTTKNMPLVIRDFNCGNFKIISDNICLSCKNLDEKGNCEKRFVELNTFYYKSAPIELKCSEFDRKDGI